MFQVLGRENDVDLIVRPIFFLSYFPPFQCMRVYEHINQSICQKQILTKYLIIRNEGRERRLIKACEVDEYCIHGLINALVLGQGAPRARYGKGERVFSMKMQFAFFKRETMNVKLVVWNRSVLLCRWTYAMKPLISARLNLSNRFSRNLQSIYGSHMRDAIQWIKTTVSDRRNLTETDVTGSIIRLELMMPFWGMYTRACQQCEEWAFKASVHTQMKNLSSFISKSVWLKRYFLCKINDLWL